MFNIKSNKIANVKSSIDNGSFSYEEWDVFSKFEETDLLELITLISNNQLEEFYLKIYFTVYNEDLVKKIEPKIGRDTINQLFSKVWIKMALETNAKELSEAMLGCVVLNSDFVSRIRAGLEVDLDNLKKFDKQIENLIKYYLEEIDKNNFYNELFQPEQRVSDKVILSNGCEVASYLKDLIEKIKTSCVVYELYAILTNSSDLDYINSLTNEELNNYEKILKEDIETNIADLNNYSFLSEKHLELINSILNTKRINNSNVYSLNHTADVVLSANVEEEVIEQSSVENAESKIFSKLSLFFKGKQEKIEKPRNKDSEIRKPVSFNDFVLTEKPKKFNMGKLLIVVFVIIVMLGWGAIIQSKHNDTTTLNNDLIEKKYKSAQFPDDKYDINRKGTKEDG